jgi:hypothetical protein
MAKQTKQRVTIFLDHSLLKHAKAEAIVEELSLTALVKKALVKYLPKETIIRKAENYD